MEQLQLGDQIIRFDKQRTNQAYASFAKGDADVCGCLHCRNFAAQREKAYPQEFRDLLAQLGIDPNKEGEVYELGINGSICEYGGWFYFTGILVEAGERLTEVGNGFTYYFSKSFPKSEIDFGDDVAAVEFYTKIPWVLSERP